MPLSSEKSFSLASSSTSVEVERGETPSCFSCMGLDMFRNKKKRAKMPAMPAPSAISAPSQPMVDQSTRPLPGPRVPYPPISLRLEPASLPGCIWFLKTCPDFAEIMTSHHDTIFGLLFSAPDVAPPPTVAAIEVTIRSMEGVAHTHGSSTPNGHAIHVSAEYVLNKPASELYGVLLHELVHVWQANGEGSAPGGFIEGLADFVRLRGGLGAAHWHRQAPGKDDKWDAGYERTGFFLDYVETRHPLAMARMNSSLRTSKWRDDEGWRDIGAKHGVEGLWRDYKKSFDAPADRAVAPPARPTHMS